MPTAELQMRSGDLEEDALDEELLPGIPNEITLNVITPKLSWRDFSVFSGLISTSACWEQAFRFRLVHKARIRAQSAETLAVVAYDDCSQPTRRKISLYSMRDNSWHEVPPIPGLAQGFPSYCRCVSLDGKLYVLGGREPGSRKGTKNVYMLDLVGQGQWKRCASMHDPRQYLCEFNSCSGVIDGKIYCVGGNADEVCSSKSEMYDPKADAWSRIKPMVQARSYHGVVTLGTELFVHGGREYKHSTQMISEQAGCGLLEAYHAIEGEWRLVEPLAEVTEATWGALFVAGGKLHVTTPVCIYVHDVDRNSRTLLQSCSFPEFDNCIIQPVAAVHMDDELLLAMSWVHLTNRTSGNTLLRSTGFGHQKNDIVWKRVKCSCCDGDCRRFNNISLMGSILL